MLSYSIFSECASPFLKMLKLLVQTLLVQIPDFFGAAGFEAFESLLIETHKLACSVRMKPIRAGRETRIRDWFQEVRPGWGLL
jgi:hypothetical protein